MKALDRQPKAADPSPYAKVPYPQRLKQEIQKQQYTKFLDIFKKLQVNIPFVEPLESMPNNAKFMKDLLSKKRKLKEFCNSEYGRRCRDSSIAWKAILATSKAMIDVEQGKLMLRMNEETVTIDVFESMKHPTDGGNCFLVNIIQEAVDDAMKEESSPLELEQINEEAELADKEPVVEELEIKKDNIPLRAPKVELKVLPSNLKYAFLGDNNTYPVIINIALSTKEEEKLLKVLKKHKAAIGWSFSDLKGINPSFCTHKILMEDDIKHVRQPQKRLNPTMKEVVRKEVVKLLDAGMIYPISDSAWVSLVEIVPKKGGVTVVRNENNELIPTRTITGWRMCVDYRRLNAATRKDRFPIPFLDQMLERLAGHAFYCFLDEYSGYNQIAVAPEDQEKTTFTCPYRVFVYRRMPFGLCNV
ncbi:uncharacterized protein LOC133292789 [Gastrolobium bilobum]|uniref:uncharacterized protein LOC133292789 n=1 Tax=Gastrolobium bilobum TaxID=150636 RepID=UPI002AB039F4|nr:uncharacterized protein LOC133292789 [Gastrolobium bilobum]